MSDVMGCLLNVCSPRRSWKEKYWLNAANYAAAIPLGLKWTGLRSHLLATDCYVRSAIVFDPNHERESRVVQPNRTSSALIPAFSTKPSGLTGLEGGGTPAGSISAGGLKVNFADNAMGFRFDTEAGKWHNRQFRGVCDAFIGEDRFFGPGFGGYDPAGADTEITGNHSIVQIYNIVLNWYCKYMRHVVRGGTAPNFTYTPTGLANYAFTGATRRKTAKNAVL